MQRIELGFNDYWIKCAELPDEDNLIALVIDKDEDTFNDDATIISFAKLESAETVLEAMKYIVKAMQLREAAEVS